MIDSFRIPSLVLAGALLVASCGSGDDKVEIVSPTASPSSERADDSRKEATRLAAPAPAVDAPAVSTREAAADALSTLTEIRTKRITLPDDVLASLWPSLGDRRVAAYELELAKPVVLIAELVDPRLRDPRLGSPRETDRIEVTTGAEHWAHAETPLDAGRYRLAIAFSFEPKPIYELFLVTRDGHRSLAHDAIPTATQPTDKTLVAAGARAIGADEASVLSAYDTPFVLDAWSWRKGVDSEWLLHTNPYVLPDPKSHKPPPGGVKIPPVPSWPEPAWLLRIACFDPAVLTEKRAKQPSSPPPAQRKKR